MNKGFRGEGLKGYVAIEVFLNIPRGSSRHFDSSGLFTGMRLERGSLLRISVRTGLHPKGILAAVMGSIHTARLTLICEHALSLWSYRQAFGADL